MPLWLWTLPRLQCLRLLRLLIHLVKDVFPDVNGGVLHIARGLVEFMRGVIAEEAYLMKRVGLILADEPGFVQQGKGDAACFLEHGMGRLFLYGGSGLSPTQIREIRGRKNSGKFVVENRPRTLLTLVLYKSDL